MLVFIGFRVSGNVETGNQKTLPRFALYSRSALVLVKSRSNFRITVPKLLLSATRYLVIVLTYLPPVEISNFPIPIPYSVHFTQSDLLAQFGKKPMFVSDHATLFSPREHRHLALRMVRLKISCSRIRVAAVIYGVRMLPSSLQWNTCTSTILLRTFAIGLCNAH